MLVIQNLYKQFGNIKAIDHVNLSIEIGEIVVLMGPSGCGKSTTIRTINRLIEPDQGTILLNNSNILTMGADELQKIRKNIGFVFQHFNWAIKRSRKCYVWPGNEWDGPCYCLL